MDRVGATASAVVRSLLDRAPLVIAHRGASAYAPEHTMAAYQLALEQGADVIEPDLQITRDGILVALHDATLERTTDVEEVFPERYREVAVDGPRTVRRWYVVDFTLEELQRLDAGSWFGPEFAGERIPTFAQVAELTRGRAGLIPETKSPEAYSQEGFDMAALLVEELARLGLAEPGAVLETPVVIQSFSAESLEALEALGSELPRVLLVGSRDAAQTWLTGAGLDRLSAFAHGIGPNKALLTSSPDIARAARERGLLVTPWTFRARSPGEGFESVDEEMRHFACELGATALFTDNPDRFPRDGCT